MTRWWTLAGRTLGRSPRWYWPLWSWWMDQQPPFSICIDCETTGLTSLRFHSLMPGRVEGKPLTGAGTCLQCAKGSLTQPS